MMWFFVVAVVYTRQTFINRICLKQLMAVITLIANVGLTSAARSAPGSRQSIERTGSVSKSSMILHDLLCRACSL